MARIYFDSNVFSKLRNKTDEKYQALNEMLIQYKKNLVFVFSHAHLRDKVNDLTDYKYLDFEFMQEFVNDNYLSYHLLEKQTSFYLATPLQVFQDNDALVNVDFVMNFMGSTYKEIRALIERGGKELPYKIGETTYDLKKLFCDGKISDNFVEFVKNTLHHKDKTKIPFYDFYVQSYGMLDMLGYSKDGLNSKNSYNNIFNDSLHSYYARYCDYLVTEDEGLIKKSRLLYDKCQDSTQILTVNEFIDQIELIGCSTENSVTDIFRKVALDLSSDNILSKSEETDSVTYNISPYQKYFNFFDNLVVIKSQAEGFYVFITKKPVHLQSSPNYRECEIITNKMTDILGSDINLKSKFDFNVEVEELKNETWTGRYWDFGDTCILLQQRKGNKEFCIQIGPLTKWSHLSRF